MRVNNLWSKGLKIRFCSNRVNLAQCQAKSKKFHQWLLFTFATDVLLLRRLTEEICR